MRGREPERLVEFDRGSRVEYDGDFVGQRLLIGVGYAQLWQCNVALNCHHFVERLRVLGSNSIKDLPHKHFASHMARSRTEQACGITSHICHTYIIHHTHISSHTSPHTHTSAHTRRTAGTYFCVEKLFEALSSFHALFCSQQHVYVFDTGTRSQQLLKQNLRHSHSSVAS